MIGCYTNEILYLVYAYEGNRVRHHLYCSQQTLQTQATAGSQNHQSLVTELGSKSE